MATSSWFPVYRCVECKTLFETRSQRIDNGGVCPFCGLKTPGTIAASEDGAARYVYTARSWWLFKLKPRLTIEYKWENV